MAYIDDKVRGEIDNILFKSRSYIIDILPTPKGGGFWL
jgi:hypothetical protein